MGRACYQRFKGAPSEDKRQAFEEITAILQRIQANRERIAERKGIVKCPQCGANVARDAQYCGACRGAALWLLNTPAFKVYDALRSGQYNQAANRYNEEIAGEEPRQRMAFALVNRYIDDTCASAIKGNISYEEAQMQLQPLVTFQDKRLSSAAVERKDPSSILANANYLRECFLIPDDVEITDCEFNPDICEYWNGADVYITELRLLSGNQCVGYSMRDVNAREPLRMTEAFEDMMDYGEIDSSRLVMK